MKVLSFAILALICLLQGASVHAQETANDQLGLLTNADASLTEPTTTTDVNPADSTPFIEGQLGLPVMRDQLTITESAQDVSIDIEDIDSSYGKMMQEFAATLEGDTAGVSTVKRAPKRHQLLDILIGFIIEFTITLIVLKIAFLMGEFRFRASQVVPICLAVACVGALLNFTLDIRLLNPIQIGLSSFVMLMLIRFMTEAHEWPAALQITLAARLASVGLAWLTFTGMMVFGL
jgi:hypothetical protein